jgi:hypothetical protein
MIRRTPELEAFEYRWLCTQPRDWRENVRLMDALYEHARAMGVFPLRDPLEGLADKVRLRRAINGMRSDDPETLTLLARLERR